jgi:hypothetical protein
VGGLLGGGKGAIIGGAVGGGGGYLYKHFKHHNISTHGEVSSVRPTSARLQLGLCYDLAMSYLHRRLYVGISEGIPPIEIVVQPHKGEWLATVWTTKPHGLAIPAQSFKTLEEGKYFALKKARFIADGGDEDTTGSLRKEAEQDWTLIEFCER